MEKSSRDITVAGRFCLSSEKSYNVSTFLTIIVSDPVSEDRHLNGAIDTNSLNAIGIEHQG